MKTTNTGAKNIIIDFSPTLMFYIAYSYSNLIAATEVLMVASLITILINKFFFKRSSFIILLSASILAIFGGMTIYSGESYFIKMKPSIAYVVFSIILSYDLITKNHFSVNWLTENLKIKKGVAKKIIQQLIYFWLAIALMNEITWRNFDEGTWVLLKTFGFTTLNFMFCIYCFFRFINKSGK